LLAVWGVIFLNLIVITIIIHNVIELALDGKLHAANNYSHYMPIVPQVQVTENGSANTNSITGEVRAIADPLAKRLPWNKRKARQGAGVSTPDLATQSLPQSSSVQAKGPGQTNAT